MFTLNNVALRPLAFADMEKVYSWLSDIELSLWGGFTPVIAGPLSRDAFRPLFENHLVPPKEDQVMLGIEFENRLIGLVQLRNIDQQMRRADIGIGIGEKNLWGQGVGKTALCLLLDYAFTVKGLERISAKVLSFNQRSQHLMEHVGFQREGLLRQYDLHQGVRQDVCVFGMLKPEFYQKFETIFIVEPSSR